MLYADCGYAAAPPQPVSMAVISMKITEIIAIGAAIVSGGSLALIQIRKIISGELSPIGLQSIKDAAKIEIDRIDKRFLLVSGVSFVVCILFAFISYE